MGEVSNRGLMTRSCQWGEGRGEKTQKSIFSNNLKTKSKNFPQFKEG